MTQKKKIAFIFPGQGAQYVGMGKDFFDGFAEARLVFQEADDLLKASFSKLIFEGPKEELTLTKNSQLAIYIMSLAILRTFQKEFPEIEPHVCAGLSLGEYTALTAASRITFKECLPLVRARGLFMHEAAESTKGTMRVVLGMEEEEIRKILPEGIWVANLNCPGQVVIAGKESMMETAATLLKEKGAKRVLPLDVSGAFHTPLMRPAQEKLKPLIEGVTLKESPVEMVMNVVGGPVTSLAELKSAMISQVTSPVFWERGIRSIESRGIDFFLEIGCGKTLSGMNKKIGVQAPTLSLEKITDLRSLCKSDFLEKTGDFDEISNLSEPAYARRPIGGERKSEDRKSAIFNKEDHLHSDLT
jgi:[acyl-carrier-protein] S-malonyltransferase